MMQSDMKCISVQSVTYAQKAVRLLQERGFRAWSVRLRDPRRAGCMWYVKVESARLREALQILTAEGVRMNGEIYDA